MVFLLLKFAIQEFMEDRDFRNVSKSTLDYYKILFNEFKGFCDNLEVLNVEDLSPKIMKNYLMYCKNERGNNPTTINTKMRKLRTFFNFLIEIEILNDGENPLRKITPLKEDIRIEVFTEEQIKQILGYYRSLRHRDKSLYAYRDYMIIIILLGTGMRVGELANLRWSNIDIKGEVITVFGKKRKEASIPMASKLKRELNEYRMFLFEQFKNLPDAVITTRDGKPLSSNGIKCIIKRLKTIMNFSDVRLSSHTFRHTFSKQFLLNGGDVFTLQRILRHESLTMTQRYVSIWGTALKEQNQKFNPLNKFDLY